MPSMPMNPIPKRRIKTMMNLKTPKSEIRNPNYQQFVLDYATYLITKGKSSYHPDKKTARIAKMDFKMD